MSTNPTLPTFDFLPRIPISVSEWAIEHRKLSINESDFPGQFSFASRPYQKEMLDVIGDDSHEEVVFMLASQLGKTIVMNTGLAWYICERMGTRAMYMLPTAEEAKKYSRIRFSAMLKDMPLLASKVTADLKKGQTLLQKMLVDGGWLAFVASGSSAQLSGLPSNVTFVDEYSRCSQSARTADGTLDEGDPLTLLKRRSEEAVEKKFVIVGTPTVKGVCPTYDRFLLSDQRYYKVPCPECGNLVFLSWESAHWDGRGEEQKPQNYKTIHFKCHCGGKIFQDHLLESYYKNMCQWVRENPDSKIAGFHINRFYSPSAKWEELAEEIDYA